MVRVSAFAITGTMLTMAPSRLMNSVSMGRNLDENVNPINWMFFVCRLQLRCKVNEPVSSRRKEVDATVDSAVRYRPLAVYMQLFFQVLFILLVDILHNGLPATGRQDRTALLSIILRYSIHFRYTLLMWFIWRGEMPRQWNSYRLVIGLMFWQTLTSPCYWSGLQTQGCQSPSASFSPLSPQWLYTEDTQTWQYVMHEWRQTHRYHRMQTWKVSVLVSRCFWKPTVAYRSQFHCFVDTLLTSGRAGLSADFGLEQSIDQRGFAQTALTCTHT